MRLFLQNIYLHRKSILLHLIAMSAFFLPVVSKLSGAIIALCFIAGLILIIKSPVNAVKTLNRERMVVAAVLLFVIGLLAVLAFTPGYTEGASEFKRYLRIIAILPLLVVIYQIGKMEILNWYRLIAISGLAMGMVSLFQTSVLESSRARGDTLSIVFGGFASIILVMLIHSMLEVSIRYGWRGNRINIVVGMLGVIGGIIALVLSASRGAWLVFIALQMIGMLFLPFFTFKKRLVIVLLIILGFTGLLLTFQERRIHLAIRSIEQYVDALAIDRSGLVGLPACIYDKRSLKNLVDGGKKTGAISIEVEHIGKLNPNSLTACVKYQGDGYFIRVVNSGEDWGHWAFLRSFVPERILGRVTLLLRGNGRVQVGYTSLSKKGRVIVHTEKFSLRAVKVLTGQTQPVVIMVPPDAFVDVIPVEHIPGEFRFNHVVPSVGTRFEMWLGALEMWKSAPVYGHGFGSFREVGADLVAVGRFAPVLSIYEHPHNEYLFVLATRGLIGLITFLILFIALMYVFVRRAQNSGTESYFAVQGVVFMSGYLLINVYEAFMNHGITMTFLSVMIALLLVFSNPGKVT